MTSVLVYFDKRESNIIKDFMHRYKFTNQQTTIRKMVRELNDKTKEEETKESEK